MGNANGLKIKANGLKINLSESNVNPPPPPHFEAIQGFFANAQDCSKSNILESLVCTDLASPYNIMKGGSILLTKLEDMFGVKFRW